MARVNRWIAGCILLTGVIVVSSALADDGKLSVRGVINAPPAGGPISFKVMLIPVVPDENGVYHTAGIPAGLQVDCDSSGSSGGEFVMDLDVGKEYEIRIDLLGPDGLPRADGTYYFADLNDPNQERSTPVVAGAEVPIPLRFKWSERMENRGNFLLPRHSSRGGFDVAQYVVFGNAAL